MLSDVFDYINNTDLKTLRKELEKCGVKFVERKDVGIVREIKFRGKPVDPIDPDALPEYADWVKDGWVYGYLIGKDVIVGEIVEFGEDYFNTEFWCRVRPETVGQAIGLLDQDNAMIYEGDIVSSAGAVGEIVFESPTFYWVLPNEDSPYDIPLDGKVIGNIHNNPELLET